MIQLFVDFQLRDLTYECNIAGTIKEQNVKFSTWQCKIFSWQHVGKLNGKDEVEGIIRAQYLSYGV